ncbi:terminase large subunit domain-containing protein [Streptomyces sp. NPDC102364]|uniref:terminase large subunit domain-containing protein n=1 Tax=Streptomyces sp. NPDC102364 TaxID=3366161 RepID=UPI00381DB6EB
MSTAEAELVRSAQELRRLAALQSPERMGRYVQGRRHHLRAHTKVVDDHLVQLGNGIDRLLIVMPPRSGKSELVCRLLPLWLLANDPARAVVISSYAASLAIKSGRWVRRMVAEFGDAFGMRLQPGAQAVNDWNLTAGGGLRSVGVLGGLTGNDMSGVGICDDPHADRAQADSLTYQEAAWDWWTSTFVSRRDPGTPVILCQTRWAPGDLAGRILDKEGRVEDGGRWHVIHLEAICTGTFPDPLGREPGDPLPHPKIPDDRDKLLAHWEEAKISSDHDWFALYQGDPQPRQGALISKQLWDARQVAKPAAAVKAAVAIDPAAGGRDVAGIIGGHLAADQRLYVTHDRSARMDSDAWARAACLLCTEIDADRIVIEKSGTFGTADAKRAIRTAWVALKEEWDEENPEPARGVKNPYDRLPPMVEVETAKKGKLLRAEPVAGQIREDRMRFGPGLSDLGREWQVWQPTSTQSPGRLDACVYLAYNLLPVPGAGKVISTAKDVNRDHYRRGGGTAPRRPY